MLERENQDTWILSPLVMIFHHCTATSVISGGFESSRGYSWITVLCSSTQYFANHISALITGQRPLVHHFCSQCSIYGKAKSRMEQAHIVPTVTLCSTVIMFSTCFTVTVQTVQNLVKLNTGISFVQTSNTKNVLIFI